jgi:hypothetical protein
MTAKTRTKPSLHRDSFVAPLARGTWTLPGACVGLRLLKHTAGPLYLSQFATDRETLTPQWPKYNA